MICLKMAVKQNTRLGTPVKRKEKCPAASMTETEERQGTVSPVSQAGEPGRNGCRRGAPCDACG